MDTTVVRTSAQERRIVVPVALGLGTQPEPAFLDEELDIRPRSRFAGHCDWCPRLLVRNVGRHEIAAIEIHAGFVGCARVHGKIVQNERAAFFQIGPAVIRLRRRRGKLGDAELPGDDLSSIRDRQRRACAAVMVVVLESMKEFVHAEAVERRIRDQHVTTRIGQVGRRGLQNEIGAALKRQ